MCHFFEGILKTILKLELIAVGKSDGQQSSSRFGNVVSDHVPCLSPSMSTIVVPKFMLGTCRQFCVFNCLEAKLLSRLSQMSLTSSTGELKHAAALPTTGCCFLLPFPVSS